MGCCNSVDATYLPNNLIQRYIEEDCNFRKLNGSSISIDKQTKIQRIEIICMGCFLYKNRESLQNHKLEIIIRDKFLDDTKYRPDLLFRRNGKIYHIEIDENSHSGYDKDKEKERYEVIKNYCITKYGSYKLIRFNPNVYGKIDTEQEKIEIAEQFANLLNNIDGLLYYENN